MHLLSAWWYRVDSMFLSCRVCRGTFPIGAILDPVNLLDSMGIKYQAIVNTRLQCNRSVKTIKHCLTGPNLSYLFLMTESQTAAPTYIQKKLWLGVDDWNEKNQRHFAPKTFAKERLLHNSWQQYTFRLWTREVMTTLYPRHVRDLITRSKKWTD